MSKEFNEPEELESKVENAEIIDDFNPLDEPVLEKAYTRPNVKVDPKDFVGDIPEPTFTPPPMGTPISEDEKVKKAEPIKPLNKEMNQMSNKDKNEAAGKFADMIMSGYKALNNWADSQLLFKEKKIRKLVNEGHIDLSVQVPVSPTQSMSVGEFVNEYNEQTKGTIKVSREFEEEVMPVLTRVLAKRGVGFTDEQYLGYLVIKDGISKGFLMQQSLSVQKEFLQMFKEATEVNRMRYTQAQPMPQTQTQPTPPPQPEPQFETRPYNPETNVNDFVNQMTGGYVPTEEPIQDFNDNEIYEEPIVEETKNKPIKAKVISDISKSGKRGRPKRNK